MSENSPPPKDSDVVVSGALASGDDVMLLSSEPVDEQNRTTTTSTTLSPCLTTTLPSTSASQLVGNDEPVQPASVIIESQVPAAEHVTLIQSEISHCGGDDDDEVDEHYQLSTFDRDVQDGATSDRTDLTSNVQQPRFWKSFAVSKAAAVVVTKDTSITQVALVNRRRHTTQQQTSVFRSAATHIDGKVIGLGDYGLTAAVHGERQQDVIDDQSSQTSFPMNNKANNNNNHRSVEQMEEEARVGAGTNPWFLLVFGNLAAFKILFFYLITLESILACLLTTAFTCYWYFANQGKPDWFGGGLDFILLAFTVTTSIATGISLSFTRRERALIAMGEFRTFSHHLMLAHSLWDWNENGGRTEAAKTVDWVEHVDAVMAQLIGIGDELSRFLTLPATNRSRHRMTAMGRREARRTMEAAYHLIDSIETQRITRLILYSERLKKIGLPSGEISRIRQYERFLSVWVEQLRLIKMYRTPQALRSFARIFTVFLPPFYAPTFAQVARETGSLGMGIAFGIIACLCLTCLFESLQVLEDPFTAFLALDGIDVREELEVLHYSQLVNTRQIAFPDAPPFPAGRRAALMSGSKNLKKLHRFVGLPPVQAHHGGHSRKPSEINLSLFNEQDAANTLSDNEFVDHEDLELGTPLCPGGFNRDRMYSDDEGTNASSGRRSHRRRATSSASDSMSRSGRGLSFSQRLSRRALRTKPTEPAVWNGEKI